MPFIILIYNLNVSLWCLRTIRRTKYSTMFSMQGNVLDVFTSLHWEYWWSLTSYRPNFSLWEIAGSFIQSVRHPVFNLMSIYWIDTVVSKIWTGTMDEFKYFPPFKQTLISFQKTMQLIGRICINIPYLQYKQGHFLKNF